MPFPRFRCTRPLPDNGAVPLVLGVTGHRDLREADLPRLRKAVGMILTTLARRYRHTPLLLLSSLAPGADQLCATVALAQGLQVRAPLPFPAAVYRESSSFETDAARQQFDALLRHPQVTAYVVPLPEAEMPEDDAAWQRLAGASDARHRCYANAGGYVVLHCHALIALWDGTESDAPAGTAQMVRFKRTGRPPAAYPWTQPLWHWADRGPVYVVHTPRASAPEAQRPVAGRRTMLFPLASPTPDPDSVSAGVAATPQRYERRQFTAMCRSLHRLNRGLRASPPPSAPGAVAALLGADVGLVPESLRQLAVLRQAAATQAQSCANRVRWLTIAVFGLIGLAALAFHVYAHHFEIVEGHTRHLPPALWAFLALLVGAFGLVNYTQWRTLEPQALDDRALAEALRVQIYWLAAGLSDAVTASYLQQMHSELSWIRQAVRACTLDLQAGAAVFAQLTAEEQRARLSRVGQRWLAGQRDYYHRSHVANHRAATRYTRGGLGLALCGWLLLAWLAVGDMLLPWRLGQAPAALAPANPPAAAAERSAVTSRPWLWHAQQPSHWLLIVAGTLVVAGGLGLAYSERRAFEELARHYHRMGVLFAHSVETLHACVARGDVAAAQGVLRDMGREALTEHASWLLLRRARPVELPVH